MGRWSGAGQLALPLPLQGQAPPVLPLPLAEPLREPAPPPRIVQRALRLSASLEARLGMPVLVVPTRNRSRYVSYVRDDVVRLRVHEALLELDAREEAVLADFVSGRRGARAKLARLFDARRDALLARSRPPRRGRLPTQGCVHDLQALLDEVRAASFPGLDPVTIGWAPPGPPPRSRIRLGSWVESLRLIRIHRRLDSEDVPRWFVASIVHHELCHAALGPPPIINGRRIVHGPEFRKLERTFPEHRAALAWERRNLQALLGR